MCGGCGRKYQRPTLTAEQMEQQRAAYTAARERANLRRASVVPVPRRPVVPETAVPVPLTAPLLKPPV